MKTQCSVLCAGLFAMSIYLTDCSTNNLAEGSSSETTNGVTITASQNSINGKTRPDALVGLYSTDYISYNDSGFADTTFANDHGGFAFEMLYEGYYNLLIRDIESSEALFVKSITLSSEKVYSISVDTIENTGAIKGNTTEIDSILFNSVFADVHIGGSPFCTKTDIEGNYLISDLPVGEYRLIFHLDSSMTYGSDVNIFSDKNIRVFPDSTTIYVK